VLTFKWLLFIILALLMSGCARKVEHMTIEGVECMEVRGGTLEKVNGLSGVPPFCLSGAQL